jgi:hypothetical protein
MCRWNDVIPKILWTKEQDKKTIHKLFNSSIYKQSISNGRNQENNLIDNSLYKTNYLGINLTIERKAIYTRLYNNEERN